MNNLRRRIERLEAGGHSDGRPRLFHVSKHAEAQGADHVRKLLPRYYRPSKDKVCSENGLSNDEWHDKGIEKDYYRALGDEICKNGKSIRDMIKEQ